MGNEVKPIKSVYYMSDMYKLMEFMNSNKVDKTKTIFLCPENKDSWKGFFKGCLIDSEDCHGITPIECASYGAEISNKEGIAFKAYQMMYIEHRMKNSNDTWEDALISTIGRSSITLWLIYRKQKERMIEKISQKVQDDIKKYQESLTK